MSCFHFNQSSCKLYSLIQCNVCKLGFNLNLNFFVVPILTGTFSGTSYFNFFQEELTSQFSTLSLPVCYMIPNCLTYFANFTCQRCVDGYYYNLTTASCASNPLPRVVPFCLTYRTATTCAQCMPGFIAPDNFTCVLNGVIPGCVQYDFTSPFTKCLACSQTTYQNSAGLCSNRTQVNITNCLNYSLNADNCNVCASGMALTTDNLACLNNVANCTTYAQSTFQTTSLVCQACSNGCYLNAETNSCTPGTVTGCNIYQANSNTCQSCLPGFYLKGNTCPAVTPINGCDVPSTTAARQCTNAASQVRSLQR